MKRTYLCVRVSNELYDQIVKALLEETEYPMLKIGPTEVKVCETSKDNKKQFIYAKAKFVVKE